MLFLSNVLKGTLDGKMKSMLTSLLLKFLVYAIGFAVLYFFFMDSIIYAGAGFIAGVLISFIILAIKMKKTDKNNKEKGDDTIGHGGID
jgi:hypothetical protein